MFNRLRKIEERLKKLECEVKTGHQLIFTEPPVGFWGIKPAYPYKFRCYHCGHTVYKSESELTEAERNYLDSLDLLSERYRPPKSRTGQSDIPMPDCKEPIPPPCEEIAEYDVTPDAGWPENEVKKETEA